MRSFSLCFFLLISTAQANPSCFDNWFCVSTAKENNHGAATIQLQDHLPVVVTVSSPAMDPSEVTLSLSDTRPRALGRVTSLERYWSTMEVSWTAGTLNPQHNDNFAYRYPVQNGRHKIVQGFNGQYSHQGASKYAIDFAVPVGTQVVAARGGKVIDLEASFDRGGPARKYARYANYVVILHDDGTTGEYYHLQKNGVLVNRGERVKQGQPIAKSGNTGFSSLPHLHFGVYKALPHGNFQSIKFNFEEMPSN
ncbi:M23 family metallopeptidase [Alteromonas ponticola]|uniref:M23 family metallopeptidase n=1 Tax=Alteromonas aquimaris TaxID=2998417 RepID=A0ABT3P8I2_9ALTE|nr:M23 family metallopeptidase [Alteromonas aquimaris]MCW8109077.1 M23 family metallopeptidase [Alteromonas aquimaris]